MQIRPFQLTDVEPLLTVFRKNVPTAFGENEVAEFSAFLRKNTDPYYVAEHEGRLVGACGHYYTTDGQIGHICWILTDPDTKGLGIGKDLLEYNLNLIRQQPDVQLVECRTSQMAYRFFEKFGFQLQYTKPDVWAPGLDLYFMTLNRSPYSLS